MVACISTILGTEFSMVKADSGYNIRNCNSSYDIFSEKLQEEKTCIQTDCQVGMKNEYHFF